VGRGISELIVHGRYTSLDLSDFSVGRYMTNRPIIEEYVVEDQTSNSTPCASGKLDP
jgi:hypothetical protein